MSTVDLVSIPRHEQSQDNARRLLNEEAYTVANATITAWPKYVATPAVSCPDIAEKTGVESVIVKDESNRLGQKSFKSLGGAYAVTRAHQRWQDSGGQGEFVVTCVTDGNHGLSVAYGAQQLGVRCVVHIPDVVTEDRAAAIASYGAEVVRFPGNYDEVTRRNRELAAENGWTIVTDTSSVEVEVESVLDVMQGYRVLGQELVDEWEQLQPTHIFLQAGCGGMAASVVGHLLTRMPLADLPTVVIVEPAEAACLVETARANAPAVVTGALHTMMAGLSVGEISLAAWEILAGSAEFFLSITDDDVAPAMRMLGKPAVDRPAVVSGETGAAGVAALLSLSKDREKFGRLGLNERSRVLAINTEGDTDPLLYERLLSE